MVVGVLAAGLVVAIVAMALLATAFLLTALTAILHGLRIDPVGTGLGVGCAISLAYVLDTAVTVADEIVVVSLPLGFVLGLVLGAVLRIEYRIDGVQRPRYHTLVRFSSTGILLCLGLLFALTALVIGPNPVPFLLEHPGWTVQVFLLFSIQGGVAIAARRDIRY